MSFSGLKIECELTPFQNLKEQTVQLAIHIDHVDDGASYDLIDTAESKVTSEPPKNTFLEILSWLDYLWAVILCPLLDSISILVFLYSLTMFLMFRKPDRFLFWIYTMSARFLGIVAPKLRKVSGKTKT